MPMRPVDLRVAWRNRTLRLGIGVFLFAFAIRLFHWYRVGIPTPRIPGDSGNFIQACDILASNPSGILAAVKGPEYAGFTLPFCGGWLLSGGSVHTWLVFQVVLSAMSCVFVYLAASHLVNRYAGVAAGVALGISYDAFRWDIALLAETIAAFSLALALWTLARYYTRPTGRNRLLVLASFAWVAFVRPQGAPIVLAWIVADLALRGRFGRERLFNSLTRGSVVCCAVLSIPLVGMFRPGGKGEVFAAWQRGWVVASGSGYVPIPRYEYTVAAASNPVVAFLFTLPDLLVLVGLRALTFFYPFVHFTYAGPKWQLIHNVTLWIVLSLALVGGVKIVRTRETHLAFMWILPLVALVGTAMLTFLGTSFRYRSIANPLFALLVGYAIGTSPRLQSYKKIILRSNG